MKTNKKICSIALTLLLILSLVFTLAACGGNSSSGNGGGGGNGDSDTEHIDSIDKDVYKFGEHYYALYTDEVLWKEAITNCENVGGYLAVITSQEENSFINGLIGDANAWIGATDADNEGTFTWVNGESFSYTNWERSQPDNYDDKEDWVHMYANGKWNDSTATSAYHYVCEWDAKEDIGTPKYTYTKTVSTVDDLRKLSNSTGNFVLLNDIDLASESNWTPIENFAGVFSGSGFTIKNLTINTVGVESVGLFGVLKGSVTDIKVDNANISARGDAGIGGIIAGTNQGTIKNAVVSGTVMLDYYDKVGGIAGFSDSGVIKDCINNASVTGKNDVGGIVGNATVGEDYAVNKCVNNGIITGKENVGGTIGKLTTILSDATYKIQDLTNNNTVTGTDRVGGTIGHVYAYTKNQSYHTYNSYFEVTVLTNNAQVTGSATGSEVGGVIGRADRLGVLTTCENKGDVSGGSYVGGWVGCAPDTNIKATGAKNNNTVTGKGYVGGFAGSAGVIENAYNFGDIVSTGIIVEDSNSRAYVGGIAGYCEGLINCENNTDIKITANGTYVGGLAGYVIIGDSNHLNGNKNVGSVSGFDYVGGIAGYVTCPNSDKTYIISDNENKNSVTGASYVGGIFGDAYAHSTYINYHTYNSYFEISVLTNTADVNGSESGEFTGGLIGYANNVTVITTCENRGDVTGGVYVGGFVGYAPHTDIKATGTANNNTITGRYKVGGFAGHAKFVQNAVNNSLVIATGKDDKGRSYLGGIVGMCNGVIGCQNNADVSVSNDGNYVGGIAGYVYLYDENYADVTRENVNSGAISGGSYIGGIIGYAECAMTNVTYKICDNENNNSVTGKAYVGGIAGYVYAFSKYSNYKQYDSYFAITDCTNSAEITATGSETAVGGICAGYSNLKTDANVMDTNTTLYGEKLGVDETNK